MVWDKPQAFALHNFVVSLLELQGGKDDNQLMWEDVAAKSNLWGSYKPTAAELQHVYDQVKFVTFAGACGSCLFEGALQSRMLVLDDGTTQLHARDQITVVKPVCVLRGLCRQHLHCMLLLLLPL